MNTLQKKSNYYQVWWVNQGQTYAKAKKEGFLWAPSPVEGGKTFEHWEAIKDVKPGDLVINYAQQKIVSVAVATSRKKKYINRKKEGWRVDVDYHELSQPIDFNEIKPLINGINQSIESNKPFNNLGIVSQGYLFNFSRTGLCAIVEAFSDRVPDDIKNTLNITSGINFSRYLKEKKFFFDPDHVKRYILSLKTKPFVLLSGNPGTGKTKLAQLYAHYLDEQSRKRNPLKHQGELLTRRWFKLSYNAKDIVNAFKGPGEQIDLIRQAILKEGLMYLGWLDTKDNREMHQKKLMKELRPGDVIIAYQGGYTIGGIGIITQGHFCDESGDAFDAFHESTRNFIRVDWKFIGPMDVKDFYLPGDPVPAFAMWVDTIYPLNKKQTAEFTDYLLSKHIVISDDVIHKYSDTYKLIPVGAGWKDHSPLLGFYNADKEEYHLTPPLEFILNAKKALERGHDAPFFLILDEMNISRIEHYFAGFLSALESHEAIPLHNSEYVEHYIGIPRNLELPSNLYVVGTISTGDTAGSIGARVMDRANVVELETVSANKYLFHSTNLSNFRSDIPFSGFSYVRNLKPDDIFTKMGEVKIQDKQTPQLNEKLINEIALFQHVLQHIGFDFGFRVINDMLKYIYISWETEGTPQTWNRWNDAFDCQILQKVLPKLNGTGGVIGTTLKSLYCCCFSGMTGHHREALFNGDVVEELLSREWSDATYQRTAMKLQFMQRQLETVGVVTSL